MQKNTIYKHTDLQKASEKILLILMGASLYFIHICVTCLLQTPLFIFFSAPNQPGYLNLIKTLIQTNPVLTGLHICLLQPRGFTSHISAEGELSGARCMRMRCQRDIWGLPYRLINPQSNNALNVANKLRLSFLLLSLLRSSSSCYNGSGVCRNALLHWNKT